MSGFQVVVINDHGYVGGGASQVAIESVKVLAGAGIPVTFICGIGPADPSIDPSAVRVVDLELQGLMSKNRSRMNAATAGIWNFDAAGKVARFLDGLERATTVVHFHTWNDALSSSVLHGALSRGFRTVLTLHDYSTACPNSGFFNYQEGKSCPLAPLSLECIRTDCDVRSYSQKLWRVARQVVQTQLAGVPSRLRHFISVSDFSERILRPWLPSSARYWRVANPIDIERAEPAAPGRSSVFSFIGRVSQEKGPTLFAAAAGSVGAKARFLGEGKAASEVEAANPRAELLGWCDRPTVRKYLMDSRAAVIPSLWHETQGMVALESAAVGVPCIVSDGCAARDYVEDGVSGLWFRSGDVDSLGSKLKLLGENPAQAAAMGLEAYRRYWRDPHTPERHLRELLVCYEGILAEAAAA